MCDGPPAQGRPAPRPGRQVLRYVYLLHTPVLPELAWRGPLGKQWPKILRRVEKVPAGDYPTSSLPTDAAHGAWLSATTYGRRRPRTDAYAHAPVQLVTPLGDGFLSERLYDDLEEWAPQLVRRTLPDKHWIPRTRPDQLASWITDFVQANEDGVPVRDTIASGRYADRFGGQLVLVTGAGSGIGRATALAFAEAGARVVGRRPGRGGRGAHGGDVPAGVGSPEAWAETVDVSTSRPWRSSPKGSPASTAWWTCW